MRWIILGCAVLTVLAGVVALGVWGIPTTQTVRAGTCAETVAGYRMRPFLRDRFACTDDCRVQEALAAYGAKQQVLACLCASGADPATIFDFYRGQLVASFVGNPDMPSAEAICAEGTGA